MSARFVLFVAVLALFSTVGVSHAQDWDGCKSAHYKARGKYAACVAKAQGKPSGSDTALETCRIKYAAAWPKLQAKYPGTACADPRFVDNLDGTVTDNMTGLVWEKKTNRDSVENPGDPHDADNTYTWTSADSEYADEDGTVFTSFLASLNAGGGFAGANGWRLPTLAELMTILRPEKYPCASQPCVEPVFGPASSDASDSSSTAPSTTSPDPYAGGRNVWQVIEEVGSAGVYDGPSLPPFTNKLDARAVRAVRGGL